MGSICWRSICFFFTLLLFFVLLISLLIFIVLYSVGWLISLRHRCSFKYILHKIFNIYSILFTHMCFPFTLEFNKISIYLLILWFYCYNCCCCYYFYLFKTSSIIFFVLRCILKCHHDQTHACKHLNNFL